MKTDWCKAFGALVLLFEVYMLAMFASEWVRGLCPTDTASIIRFSVFFFSTLVIGVGLLCGRKWAAFYFSLATSAMGLWVMIASILDVPFPWNLINITFGVILMLPTIGVIDSWSILKWGGKWYL